MNSKSTNQTASAKAPKTLAPLTELEIFVYQNRERSCPALATETNRTEAAITAAYNRAFSKIEEAKARAERVAKTEGNCPLCIGRGYTTPHFSYCSCVRSWKIGGCK